jgi:anti-anti-sigma regulatory factor
MLTICDEKMNDLAVVECKGRIVRSDAVFKLRDAVMAQAGARIIALDLSEVSAIGGGGLGMLAFLQHWADERHIQLKLFSPSRSVMEGLCQIRSALDFDVATFHELMGILGDSDMRYGEAETLYDLEAKFDTRFANMAA